MFDRLTLASGEEIDLGQYPLPDGVENATLNRAQLARAMNVSETTLSKWIAAGMPVATEGGNGQAYEFDLHHCYAWRLWRTGVEDEKRQRADKAAAQLALTFLSVDDGDDADRNADAMDPKKVRELAEAEFHRMRAAEMRGDLVRRDRVEKMLENVLSIMRETLVGYGDFLEAELGLEPAQVATVQTRADQALRDLRHGIEVGINYAPSVAPISAGAMPDRSEA